MADLLRLFFFPDLHSSPSSLMSHLMACTFGKAAIIFISSFFRLSWQAYDGQPPRRSFNRDYRYSYTRHKSLSMLFQKNTIIRPPNLAGHDMTSKECLRHEKTSSMMFESPYRLYKSVSPTSDNKVSGRGITCTPLRAIKKDRMFRSLFKAIIKA